MEQAAAILLLGGNAWTDLRRQRISIMLTAGIFLAAVIMRVRYGEYAALAAGMIPGILLLCLAWLTREALGYGDGLVEIVLGALLGWRTAVEILFSPRQRWQPGAWEERAGFRFFRFSWERMS